MHIVEFDGFGQPADPSVKSGCVLLLIQDGAVEVLRIQLLPPEE